MMAHSRGDLALAPFATLNAKINRWNELNLKWTTQSINTQSKIEVLTRFMAAYRRAKKTKTKWVPVVNGNVPKSVSKEVTSKSSNKENFVQRKHGNVKKLDEKVATVNRKPLFLWEALIYKPQENGFDAPLHHHTTIKGKNPTMKMNLEFINCILSEAFMRNSADSLNNEEALLRCWKLYQCVIWLREQRSQKIVQEETAVVEGENLDTAVLSESVDVILELSKVHLMTVMEPLLSFLQKHVSPEKEYQDTKKNKKKRLRRRPKKEKAQEESNQAASSDNQIENISVEKQVLPESPVLFNEKEAPKAPIDSEKVSLSGIERFFMSEIINITTEIVQCRVPWRDRELLVRWQNIIDSTKQKLQECDHLWNNAQFSKAVKSPYRAIISVCNNRQRDLQEFTKFLHTYEQKEANGLRPLCAPEVAPDQQESVFSISEEIWNLFSTLHITEQDEQLRIGIAHRIQQSLHRSRYRLCLSHTLQVYGSSRSGFGAKSADIDLCFSVHQPPQPSSSKPPQDLSLKSTAMETQDASYVQREEAGTISFAFLLQMQKQVWGKLEKLNAEPDDDFTDPINADTDSSDPKNGDPKRKNIKKVEEKEMKKYYATHLGHFHSILQQMYRKYAQSEVSGEALISSSTNHSSNPISDKANLFKLRETLEMCGYKIRAIIHHARVPIIRFLDPSSQIECDLSFGNLFARANTLLLRSYAYLDKSLQIIGFAVKHWAKCRGLVDAAGGYLSSYSFVIMTIYYYLVRTHLIANLQDHQLIRQCYPDHADRLPLFCTQLEQARQCHTAKLVEKDCLHERTFKHLDLSALLVGFFDFYANIFNFASHVICIRLARSIPPIEYIDKIDRWGSNAKIWRISIGDPLEVNRDLGCVVRPNTQKRIFAEFTRAHKQLTNGQSFVSHVCCPGDKA
uniref:Poly(A) polymerase putative n=1 Tax=Albugo laibachii Nc14 TaxID=890382 RepID=F0WBG8_9STRA|nr:Poly(A) polymerase putative [Albugo laibachii Nc14]|eukprot:CCA18494.1 Poly(A) polymerase putative [Albugo laibachii Nc14]